MSSETKSDVNILGETDVCYIMRYLDKKAKESKLSSYRKRKTELCILSYRINSALLLLKQGRIADAELMLTDGLFVDDKSGVVEGGITYYESKNV